MYAVMGITGQVGGAVARMLLATGQAVRAIVRNADKARSWKKGGVKLASADYRDANALRTAFTGVEGVFVMIPPNFAPEPEFPETRAIVAAIKAALDAAKPPKAVYLSSIGAQQTTGIGLITTLHILEQELGDLPIPGTFLRPGWFMENSLWDVPSARDQGKVFSFLQPLDKPFPLVATADVGRVAAESLLQTWTGNRYVEVAGPQRYSPRQIAATFARVLNRPVEAVAVPRDAWVETFVGQGTPVDRTAYRVEMLDAFNSGWIDFGVPGTEHTRGRVPLDAALAALLAHP
jgi:NAD(P)H dehydrogenase (quinone)